MSGMHYRVSILFGVVVCCGGCMTPTPFSYVAPTDPVALVEVLYTRQRPSIQLRHVDGQMPERERGPDGASYGVELNGGHHVLDVRLEKQIRTSEQNKPSNQIWLYDQPLVIEFEARTGHNYRICAHAHDVNTVSLYLLDILTGEVVSGRRPEIIETPLLSDRSSRTVPNQTFALSSTPSGARVTVNGTFRGFTPVSMNLLWKQEYHVALGSDGYEPYAFDIKPNMGSVANAFHQILFKNRGWGLIWPPLPFHVVGYVIDATTGVFTPLRTDEAQSGKGVINVQLKPVMKTPK